MGYDDEISEKARLIQDVVARIGFKTPEGHIAVAPVNFGKMSLNHLKNWSKELKEAGIQRLDEKK